MELSQEQLLILFKSSLENPPSSRDELKNWIYVFLGLDIPDTHLPDEDSNASPMEALWVSYENYKNNRGDEEPGYIWLASRDSMKTLAASILAVVVMVFFNASICWLASIEPQSKIALSNVQSFIQKLSKFLEYCDRKVEASNARTLEITTKEGGKSSVTILVATMASVNGKHVNCVFVDEVDLLRDPRVLDEVQAVASLIGNQFPLKTYFSTRKFAFSNMETLIQKRDSLGLKLLKWDILDVTERCPESRHKPEEPKVVRYIHRDPPLRSYSQEEFDLLAEVEQAQYQKIDAYAGCAGCRLLPQCKMRLAHRSPEDRGKLWKRIDHTINMFRSMSPDMANAQLLCRKPSQSGLVYPRFEEKHNSYTISDAYYQFTGERVLNPSLDDLIALLHKNEIAFYVGGDWGHTAAQAFVVSAVMPAGEWWIIDTYAIPGLEFDDILTLGKKIRDIYHPKKWFMDTNQPMFIKTFDRNGMRCADFKKDVAGGIESVRAQVVDSAGRRRLKVIKHERNDILFEGFKKHHFIIDSLGRPSGDPDDGNPWSDVMDSLRYKGQNLFGTKSQKPIVVSAQPAPVAQTTQKTYEDTNRELMKNQIRTLAQETEVGKTRKKNGFHWNF